MKRVFLLISVVFALLLLAGCGAGEAPDEPGYGSAQGSTLDKSEAGEVFLFNVRVEQAMVNAGQTVQIQGSGLVETGGMRIVLRKPDGQEAWNPGLFRKGDFSVNTHYKPTSAGVYRLGVMWEAGTKATYNLGFQGFALTPLVVVPGLGMILVGLVFVIWALRWKGGWRYLALGAALWVGTVAVKFAIAVPLNPLVSRALYREGNLWAPTNLLLYVYIGALTGVTEVLLTWLLVRYTRVGQASWPKALAFGVGFGAFEALLLGFASFGTALAGLFSPGVLPGPTMAGLAQANNLLFGFAPIAERAGTIFVHVLCNVLLFYGAQQRQSRWFWMSFLFKTGLDTAAAFAQFWGVETVGKIWTIEAIIILFGVVGWWGTQAIARRYRDDAVDFDRILIQNPVE